MRKIDLTGMRFSRLLVLGEGGRSRTGVIMWDCLCDCGARRSVFGAALRSGNTKSCGCKKSEDTHRRNITHGMSRSDLYAVWCSMKARCHRPSDADFHLYGGRGISVCDRWKNSFTAFVSDMGPRPDGFSVERIDNQKGYSPGNCKWASSKEQSANRRVTRYLTFGGVSRPLLEWAALLGIKPCTIYQRLHGGASDEDALNTRNLRRRYISHNGKEMSLAEWSAATGIRKGTIYQRLRAGWSVDRALTREA